jgi:2-hydroxychromene-2-carboxylate isomerase
MFMFGAMSPYSWFAAERIDGMLPDARWRGVFAGAIFKAHDRVSWGSTEYRAGGIADCEARAAAHGLGPIRWPDPWPTSDLLIARAMTFAERSPPAPHEARGGAGAGERGGRSQVRALGLAAMRLAFLDGADLGEQGAVLEAGRRAGIDPDSLADALGDPDIKDALRSSTDEALALGVFGVPTIVVGEELYWGDDRLEQAAAAQRSLLSG